MKTFKWQGKDFICSCGSAIYDPVNTQGMMWRCNSCLAVWEYWHTKFTTPAKRRVAFLIAEELEHTHWICKHCAEFVPAHTLCPHCGANQTITLAACDARAILKWLEESENDEHH